MVPFLEILTRTFNARPHLLRINQESLRRQTDPDWTQTLLVDDVGRGVLYAGAMMADYAPRLVGNYIWALDDDDTCIYPALVAELKELAGTFAPDIFMIRMEHGDGRILPDDGTWGVKPREGRIGCSAYVVRRALWVAHAQAWASGRYAHDFDFIASLWDAWPPPVVYWHNVVASRVMRQSYGQPEAARPWAMQASAIGRAA